MVIARNDSFIYCRKKLFTAFQIAIGYFTKKAGDQFDLRLSKNPLYFLIL